MPVTRGRCHCSVSRRPRGICPVCRTTLSLCWSGEIRVLRKHSVGDEPCGGAGLPAVGELTEIHGASAGAGAGATAGAGAPVTPAQQQRVASVA